MGENEMKPKHGLPCGVRLTAGLGGAGGTAALALAAETLAERERRATLTIGVVFTTGSVPELSPVRHRLGTPDWRCIRSRPCARTEPNTTPTWRANSGAANGGGGSIQLRVSGAKLGGEQRTSGSANATHRGGIEARSEAFHLAKFFALVRPNV